MMKRWWPVPYKFLHTSDWHAGAGRNLDKIHRGTLDYLRRLEFHWRGVIEVAKREKVHFALIAGDMFENSGTTIEELICLYQVLRDFGQVCPVIASAGNHDELEVGDFQTKYLALMNIPGVYVAQGEPISLGLGLSPFREDKFVPDPAGKANVRVLVMPWTGLKEQSDFNARIQERYTGEPIVMLHECFKDIQTDTGYRAKIGVQVPDIQGVKYFALGDIHKHQNVSLPHAWYSGAPGQYNFGDKPGKGCIVVDVTDTDYTPRFIEIPSNIELHQITSLEEIPATSPHWYQLIVPANRVPSAVPANVKEIKPIPAKLDIPVEFSKEENAHQARMSINYVDGVEKLLTEAGFAADVAKTTMQELEGVVRAG